MKLALFVCDDVGLEVARYFFQQGIKVDALVMNSNEAEDIKNNLLSFNLSNTILYSDDLKLDENVKLLESMQLDLGILAWWHYIVKPPLLKITKLGFLNFHPSLLPYNRGKHYYFWNIVEAVPFGVTLHLIDEEIDKGHVVFQKMMQTTWLDNGYTLRERAKTAILALFKDHFIQILSGDLPKVPINWEKGSQHWGHELQKASEINLDERYSGREIINLIRARSGFEYGGAWFVDEGKCYEINVSIKDITKEDE